MTHKHSYDEDGMCTCGAALVPDPAWDADCPNCGDFGCKYCDDTFRCEEPFAPDAATVDKYGRRLHDR